MQITLRNFKRIPPLRKRRIQVQKGVDAVGDNIQAAGIISKQWCPRKVGTHVR